MSPLNEYFYESDDESQTEESSFDVDVDVDDNQEKNGWKHSKIKTNTSSSNNNISDSNSSNSNSLYYEHIVLPSDTLQGLCLKYKTTQTKLRQTNKFSGNNLALAPKKLFIPKQLENLHMQQLQQLPQLSLQMTQITLQTPGNTGNTRGQDRTTEEYKIHYIMSCFDFINCREVKDYCSRLDWNVELIIETMGKDFDCNANVNANVSANANVNTNVNARMGIRQRMSKDGQEKQEECKENHYRLRLLDIDFSGLGNNEKTKRVGDSVLDLNPFKKSIAKITRDDGDYHGHGYRHGEGHGDGKINIDMYTSSEFGIEMKDMS